MERPATDRVRVRRQPERGQYSRAEIEAVLDAALVVHVAFVHDGQPICIPTLCARAGDRVLVHGSSASRTLRTLAGGVPACLTATVIDGLVLARSVFEHSVNYRSAVLIGSFARLEGDDERMAGYEAFTEKLLPGRWDEARSPSELELRATEILAMPIEEASAKVPHRRAARRRLGGRGARRLGGDFPARAPVRTAGPVARAARRNTAPAERDAPPRQRRRVRVGSSAAGPDPLPGSGLCGQRKGIDVRDDPDLCERARPRR